MRLLLTLLLILVGPACATGRAAHDFVNPCDGSDPAACARFVAAVRGADPEQPAIGQQVVRACLAGDTEACHLHASTLMLKPREEFAEDNRRGFLLASRLCEEGHIPACVSAGSSRLCDAPAECEALLGRACGAGEGRACTVMAHQGVEEARQVTLLDQACAAARPDASACYSLGSWYREREASAPERAKAAPLLERACGLGVPTACYELALLSRESPDGAQRAESLLARACAAGEEAACGEAFLAPCRQGQAAACRRLGAVQVQDAEAMKRRTQVLEGACSLKVAEACGALAQQGRGDWARGCELGDARACIEAARERLQAASRTGADGKQPGLALLERGCASEHPARNDACEQLASWLLADAQLGDPGRAVELLERGCQAGHAGSCETLGTAWWDARGVERHRMKGLESYARHCELQPGQCSSSIQEFRAQSQSCEEGASRGCLELGRLLDAGDEPLKADDWAAVSKAYQRACELGEVEGCTAMVRTFVGGRGQDRSLALVIQTAARACKLGDVESCAQEKQYSALQAGCAANKPAECQRLADFQLKPPASAADRERGVALLERYCQRGTAPACVRLAELFESDEWGFEPELQRTVAYQERAVKAGAEGYLFPSLMDIQAARAACDKGEPKACAELADGYLSSLKVMRKPAASTSPDWAHAKAALEKACGPGRAEPCLTLAGVLLGGARIVRAPGAGQALLEAHCTQAPGVCEPMLAELMSGELPGASPQQTLGLLRKTCDAGMKDSCFMLGTAHEEGRFGLEPSAASAAEVYRKACDAGSQRACSRLR
ncbi:sel1 repeat family protein [Pyxidicoccus trucidator]|uniref:sel1 repeat family protein n=1 Tax=Pyxidicoccus trucidator TaxID=2709662 RepID=UPI0013D9B199|nr:sel1 repeat family protein [Pyxidicoccus trucidator]